MILSSSLAKICLPTRKQNSALFVFGDSLFDVGNNNYINTIAMAQANYPPYGETFFKYPSGRFSDGRIIPDFIAEYAGLPLIQPYLFPGNQEHIDGVNFASGGAGVLVETFQGLVIDLQTQLSYFKRVTKKLRQKLGDAEAKNLLARAVYFFHIGGNDYSLFFSGNSTLSTSYSPEQFADLVIGNLTTVIKEIHKEGGRKFGFLKLAPYGCLPASKLLVNGSEGSYLEDLSSLSMLHNTAFSVQLQKLEKQLEGFKYSFFDLYDTVLQLINNPSKYGFKGNEACCGSGPYRGYFTCGGKGEVKDYELSKICHPTRKHNAALFVFGDSLFDVGNNNYINTTTQNQANYSPYGETFFKYPSGRFSDGRVIPDFIAKYAELPLIQPYLFPGNQEYIDGVNFASGGAGALVETFQGFQGLVIDLKTQLSYFKRVTKKLRLKLGDAEAKHLLARAVYFIHIGGNDYSAFFSGNSTTFTSYSPKQYVDLVIGNLTSVIKEIHKQGGRKFGLLKLAPLGCVPASKVLVNGSEGSCLEDLSSLARMHNIALSVQLQKLEKQLEGFKYSLFDLYDIVLQVINYPSKYGFKVGDEACCGSGPYRGYYSCGGKRAVKDYELCENPNEYLFFDSTHPTQKANEFVSQMIWSGRNQSLTGPYNLKTLFQQ
ncbi:GDSL esterase/lipase 5 [Senna tora]|uniref:GDSL esterase/lipase 5 n=1 Tax=Senna tora TaxID=362788 RepID=A0A834XFL2_9FABA|nr:GDSL esterase/lipase 5 [Senna tora]